MDNQSPEMNASINQLLIRLNDFLSSPTNNPDEGDPYVQLNVGSAAEELYRQYLLQVENGYNPSTANESGLVREKREAFRTAQFNYAASTLTALQPEINDALRVISQYNGLGDLESVIYSCIDQDQKQFHFDRLFMGALTLLEPLAYQTESNVNAHSIRQLYFSLKSLAEIAGNGTIYDQGNLIGMTAEELEERGIVRSAGTGVLPEDPVRFVRRIGFVPKNLGRSPRGSAVVVTEPHIEPDVWF